MRDSLDIEIGSYKEALDLCIKKVLAPNAIGEGPYLGVVLRVDNLLSSETMSLNNAVSYYPLNQTKVRTEQRSYKVRVISNDLDSCLPDPKTFEHGSKLQESAIESHTSFLSIDNSLAKASVGQLVWVDYSENLTEPVYRGPYADSEGNFYHIPGSRPTQSSKEAFDKCRNITLTGAPDGNSVSTSSLPYTDGDRNFVVTDGLEKEPNSKESIEPKNTFPRECSTFTSRDIYNGPDNAEEEENLTYLETEIIPRLLPFMVSVDSRIRVTSVYRSDALNDAVNGSPTSWHKTGLAVDFGGVAGSNDVKNEVYMKVAKELKKNRSKFPFLRTVIVELWRPHIHIDVYDKGEKPQGTRFRVWAQQNDKMERLA